MAGGIEAVAASVSADLVRRLPRQNKKQREGLSLLVATMLDVPNFRDFRLTTLRTGAMAGAPCPIELMKRQLPPAPMAAAMGCSEGSVKTHCSRATHTLAKALRAKGITL